MTAGRVIAVIAAAGVAFGGLFAIGRATANDEEPAATRTTAVPEAPGPSLKRLAGARALPALRGPRRSRPAGDDSPAAATPAPAAPAPAPQAAPTPQPSPAPAPSPTPAPAPSPSPGGGDFDDSG